MPLHGKHAVAAVCLVAGLGIVFEGYDQGVMSGVNISPSYIELMGLGDGTTGTTTKTEKEGGIVAIYYLGTLIGALAGGALCTALDETTPWYALASLACWANPCSRLRRMLLG